MKIAEEIKKIILESCSDLKLSVVEEEIKIEHPADVSFGDYSTNIAMILAKQEKINPKELAQKIVNSIDKSDFVEKVGVAGAGFINFYLKSEFLIKEAEKINYESIFKNELSENGKGKTMVIDYSAPNIAKPFGIGHLRSTNIGQAIYNIYKILGWNCVGDNHIGDWGTQYGKLVAAIKKWNKKDLNDLTIDDLEKLYVKFHKEAETDKKLIDEGRDWFAKLEKGDKEAKEIWQKCIDISMVEFEKVYELLGVNIDFVHGESFYEEKLEEVTKEIIDKGITKKSEGAIIIEFDDTPPAMLQKSNGTTTYFTRDMATIRYRMENWKPNLIIYEVGADQQLHFKQVFKTAEMMGWMPDERMVHIAHGLIRWTTGKFSTRKGDTIHLSDVIDKAMERAKEMAPENDIETIEAVAIGAIKFNDLSSDPRKDVIFDWDQIMSLDGDSGPYLQYTYARCKSVLDKTKIKEQKNINEIPENINDDEMALIKEFYRFEEKIMEASERFSPSVIAEYLLGVARKYNEFYAKNRIIDQKEEVFRVFLTRVTVSILKTGLNLLGIKTVERM
ncbi:MAG: arginine--tRNA ligase [Candidatus Shapirobacteria bacterium]|nr:arginine--tRNA ligase [Candidatus Shapirobacteria bacterium]MDD4383179.1 arginine--tRNA ligase [Candidatus Shapirobacteria bacterium]